MEANSITPLSMAYSAVSCNLSQIPLTALGYKARDLLSGCLDKTKVIASSQGYPRDYRGLAELAGVPCNDVKEPTRSVLAAWSKSSESSMQDLVNTLQLLDRWDVAQDLLHLLETDALNYIQQKQQQKGLSLPSDRVEIMTFGDAELERIGVGAGERFDAYLLHADEDMDVALQIVDTLENTYSLKLCVKDRDLLPGVGFEHEAITRLVTERCNYLIAVISPSLVNSPAHKFIYNYSLALALNERGKKILPCIFKVCDPVTREKLFRNTFSAFCLDFTRPNPWDNNWQRLSRAVSSPRFSSCDGVKEIEDGRPANAIEESKPQSDETCKLKSDHSEDPLPPNMVETPSDAHNGSVVKKGASRTSDQDGSSCTGQSTAYLLPNQKSPSSLIARFKNTKIVKAFKEAKKKKKTKVALPS